MKSNMLRILAAINFVATMPALAQKTPIVLVNGIHSDSGTWSTATLFLNGAQDTAYTAGTFDWRDHIATQGDTLANYVASIPLGSSSVLVGHSQGGLVSRYAARNTSVLGIVTIGSPHYGAPMIDAGPDMVEMQGNLELDIFAANQYLTDCQGNECNMDLPLFADFSGAVDLTMVGIEFGQNFFAGGGVDIPELSPGSAVVADLATNWTSEHATSRVSLVVDDGDEYAGFLPLLPLVGPDPGAADAFADWITNWGLTVLMDGVNAFGTVDPCGDGGEGGGGIDPGDPDDCDDPLGAEADAAAFALSDMGLTLWNFAPLWSEWVGGDPFGGHDGIVPTWSQVMPGTTQLLSVVGRTHLQETGDGPDLLRGVTLATGSP